ncbi:TetR/AcrR family transcriptional regulator [Streptomyces capparidis]
MKTTKPRLRADACRNRERIIAAACDALVEHGPEVSLDEIARRAGVGNATVYRRFADRRQLIVQVGSEVMRALAEEADRALAEEPDAFAAVRRFAHRAADRRLGAVLPSLAGYAAEDDAEFEEARQRLMAAVENLMTLAQSSGMMRADVGVGDLTVALTQLTRPLPGTTCVAVESFVHRHLDILLDGLRAPGRSELSGTTFTLADLRRACGRHSDD